ncbi:MAG: ABC transporter substrate-binding protein [Planctomycetaceae bacterium]
MMMRQVFAGFVLLTMLSLGCDKRTDTSEATVQSSTPRDEILVRDRLQRELRFSAVPQRIISLAPATTELMFAIGAGKQLVGVTKNCNFPPEAETLTRVGGGTLESLSREVIVSLQPDLVLCRWDHHQPLMDTLEQFHIQTLAIGPETLEELFAEATMLGEITGHVVETEQLVSQMKQRLGQINAKVKRIPESERRKVFYEVWDEPLMTAGPSSFIGEALTLAGMKNIFSDVMTGYPKVSDELVVQRNPDVILSPSTHISRVTVEQMLQRQGWGDVKAIREKQVFIIDGDHISRCGPRLLDAIEEMIRVVYPEHAVNGPVAEELNP